MAGGRTGGELSERVVPIRGSGESHHCGHEAEFVDHTGRIIPCRKDSVKSALLEVRFQRTPLAA